MMPLNNKVTKVQQLQSSKRQTPKVHIH